MTHIHPPRLVAVAVMLCAAIIGPKAHAVPSFARQTGLACEACHTVFPELNHFGRMFKASGYTLDNLKQVRDINSEKEDMLLLSSLAPLSAMVQISQTWLNQPLPDLAGNGDQSQTSTTGFPQQLSLFYAGKIAPHLGAFIQITYDNASRLDRHGQHRSALRQHAAVARRSRADLRPERQQQSNRPGSVEQHPGLGIPVFGQQCDGGPLASAEIDGTLAQDVAGLSAYVMWNESLYGEIGVYHSAKQGATNPITGAAGPLDGTTSNVISGRSPLCACRVRASVAAQRSGDRGLRREFSALSWAEARIRRFR